MNKDINYLDNVKYLYHGSPFKIVDTYIATETYFTDDFDIAKEYGEYVYSIDLDLDEKLRTIFCLDSLREHFMNIRLIPLHLFEIK